MKLKCPNCKSTKTAEMLIFKRNCATKVKAPKVKP